MKLRILLAASFAVLVLVAARLWRRLRRRDGGSNKPHSEHDDDVRLLIAQREARAASPQIPCTPPPGGVDAEHR